MSETKLQQLEAALAYWREQRTSATVPEHREYAEQMYLQILEEVELERFRLEGIPD